MASGDGNKQSVVRLATIKPSRDLTLGGASGSRDVTRGGKLKRKFVPNIPAQKSKTNDQIVDTPSATNPKPSFKTPSNRPHNTSHPHERGGRGRGRGRGQELVQLKSIFDEGPMEQLGMKAARAASSSYFGSGSKPSSSTAPNRTKLGVSIKKEKNDDVNNGDKDDDKELLADLLRDNFIDDGDDDDDDDGVEKPKKHNPVLLPFSGIPKKDFKVETKFLQDIKKTKPEPHEHNTSSMEMDSQYERNKSPQQQSVVGDVEPNFNSILNKVINSSATSENALNLDEILDLNHLYLIQLPDVLPGYPPTPQSSSSLTTPSSSSRPATSSKGGGDAGGSTSKDKSENQGGPYLKDFSEGCIGKLRFRRSGKMELVLGDIVLEGVKGVPAEFLQEAVMIDKEHEPNRFMRLGNVSEKISFIPNLVTLLEQAELEKGHKS